MVETSVKLTTRASEFHNSLKCLHFPLNIISVADTLINKPFKFMHSFIQVFIKPLLWSKYGNSLCGSPHHIKMGEIWKQSAVRGCFSGIFSFVLCHCLTYTSKDPCERVREDVGLYTCCSSANHDCGNYPLIPCQNSLTSILFPQSRDTVAQALLTLTLSSCKSLLISFLVSYLYSP